MPIYSVQGPDGRIYDVEGPAGASESQLINAVRRQILSAQPEKKPEERGGVGSAFNKGIESLLSSGRTAIGAFTGSPEEAARAGIERGKNISERYGDSVSMERVKKAYEEQGILPAAGEVISQIPSALAEQLPNMGTTIAGANVGRRVGKLFGPTGELVGAGVGAAVPSLIQQFGGNIERQAQEGAPINRGTAAAAALPQAALDVAGTFIPLGRNLISKLVGIPPGAFMGKTAAQVEKLANERLLTTLTKGTAVGAVAEIPTEIAQQMLERAQAGLSLTSPDALKEYGETAYQVGLLAPLGAVGRLGDRASARGERQQAQDVARQEEQARLLQEEEDRAAAQQKEKEQAAAITAAKKAGTPELLAMMGDQTVAGQYSPLQDAETKRAQKIASAAQNLGYTETDLQEMTPDDVHSMLTERTQNELAQLSRVLPDLQKQIQTAKNDKDFERVVALSKQLAQLGPAEDRLLATRKELVKLAAPTVNTAALDKELQLAIDSQDFEKAAKIATQLKGVQHIEGEPFKVPGMLGRNVEALPTEQMDMFSPAFEKQMAQKEQEQNQQAKEQITEIKPTTAVSKDEALLEQEQEYEDALKQKEANKKKELTPEEYTDALRRGIDPDYVGPEAQTNQAASKVLYRNVPISGTTGPTRRVAYTVDEKGVSRDLTDKEAEALQAQPTKLAKNDIDEAIDTGIINSKVKSVLGLQGVGNKKLNLTDPQDAAFVEPLLREKLNASKQLAQDLLDTYMRDPFAENNLYDAEGRLSENAKEVLWRDMQAQELERLLNHIEQGKEQRRIEGREENVAETLVAAPQRTVTVSTTLPSIEQMSAQDTSELAKALGVTGKAEIVSAQTDKVSALRHRIEANRQKTIKNEALDSLLSMLSDLKKEGIKHPADKKRLSELRVRYVQAALKEAAHLRAAENQPPLTPAQIMEASNSMHSALKELSTRLASQPEKEMVVGQVNNIAKMQDQLAKLEGPAREALQKKLNKAINQHKGRTARKIAAKQDELKRLRQEMEGYQARYVEPLRQQWLAMPDGPIGSKQHTDREAAQQKYLAKKRGFDIYSEKDSAVVAEITDLQKQLKQPVFETGTFEKDVRPLGQRPFANPQRAIETLKADLAAASDKLMFAPLPKRVQVSAIERGQNLLEQIKQKQAQLDALKNQHGGKEAREKLTSEIESLQKRYDNQQAGLSARQAEPKAPLAFKERRDEIAALEQQIKNAFANKDYDTTAKLLARMNTLNLGEEQAAELGTDLEYNQRVLDRAIKDTQAQIDALGRGVENKEVKVGETKLPPRRGLTTSELEKLKALNKQLETLQDAAAQNRAAQSDIGLFVGTVDTQTGELFGSTEEQGVIFETAEQFLGSSKYGKIAKMRKQLQEVTSALPVRLEDLQKARTDYGVALTAYQNLRKLPGERSIFKYYSELAGQYQLQASAMQDRALNAAASKDQALVRQSKRFADLAKTLQATSDAFKLKADNAQLLDISKYSPDVQALLAQAVIDGQEFREGRDTGLAAAQANVDRLKEEMHRMDELARKNGVLAPAKKEEDAAEGAPTKVTVDSQIAALNKRIAAIREEMKNKSPEERNTDIYEIQTLMLERSDLEGLKLLNTAEGRIKALTESFMEEYSTEDDPFDPFKNALGRAKQRAQQYIPAAAKQNAAILEELLKNRQEVQDVLDKYKAAAPSDETVAKEYWAGRFEVARLEKDLANKDATIETLRSNIEAARNAEIEVLRRMDPVLTRAWTALKRAQASLKVGEEKKAKDIAVRRAKLMEVQNLVDQEKQALRERTVAQQARIEKGLGLPGTTVTRVKALSKEGLAAGQLSGEFGTGRKIATMNAGWSVRYTSEGPVFDYNPKDDPDADETAKAKKGLNATNSYDQLKKARSAYKKALSENDSAKIDVTRKNLERKTQQMEDLAGARYVTVAEVIGSAPTELDTKLEVAQDVARLPNDKRKAYLVARAEQTQLGKDIEHVRSLKGQTEISQQRTAVRNIQEQLSDAKTKLSVLEDKKDNGSLSELAYDRQHKQLSDQIANIQAREAELVLRLKPMEVKNEARLKTLTDKYFAAKKKADAILLGEQPETRAKGTKAPIAENVADMAQSLRTLAVQESNTDIKPLVKANAKLKTATSDEAKLLRKAEQFAQNDRIVKMYAKDSPEYKSAFKEVTKGYWNKLKEDSKYTPGTVYRLEEALVTDPMNSNEAQKIADKFAATLPKDVKFIYAPSMREAPARFLKALYNDNVDIEKSAIKGGVMSDGTIVVIGDMHSNALDLERTLMHEAIGHYGVDIVLGPQGMMDLTKAVRTSEGGIYGMAKALGVDEEVRLTALAWENRAVEAERKGDTEKAADIRRMGEVQAMREMLAHLQERTVDESFVQKAGRYIKVILGAVRNWLRSKGLTSLSTINTSDLYYTLFQATKRMQQDFAGAYESPTGLISLRPVYATPELAAAAAVVDKAIARERNLYDKIKANGSGLAFETQLVDRFAGFERLSKTMDSLQGMQMMYYLRMYDMRMNFVAQSVGNGALQRTEKTRADGRKEYIIESTKGPSIRTVAEILKKAAPLVGSPDAASRFFTLYLANIRAKTKGTGALSISNRISDTELASAERAIANTPGLEALFKQARAEYNEYNKGLVRFAGQTNAIPRALVDKLLKDEDYVPYYRQRNGVVELLIGGESPIRIGNIKEQPYLQELVGGDQPILDFMTSAVQNTNLLTDMSLRNLATKNAVFELEAMDLAKISRKVLAGPNIVKFKIEPVDEKDTGERYALINTDKAGIPADILVKGMEGIPTQLPFALRVLSAPATFLRKAVVASPLYAARQLFRDSLAAPLLSGADFMPVIGAMSEIGSATKNTLESRGITGGQVFTGGSEDLTKILRDITAGKGLWAATLAKAESISMEADAVTRRAQYNSYIKQGLSEMEATYMALESMNFSKRGASPSIHWANAMIPFFNAQIQSLNVLYKALTGNMPFNERLKIQEKLLMRGFIIAAGTMAYAAMMQDDEAYKNATPDQKYGNWFVRVPGLEEPLRIPIPFEIGYIFKALPEALYNSLQNKHGGEEAVKALNQILINTIPGGTSMATVDVGGFKVPTILPIPQALKPIIETSLGKSFYTQSDIVPKHLQTLLPEAQFNENTTEIAKAFGKKFGASPIVVENLVKGYTGSMGLAFLQAVSSPFSGAGSPEKTYRRWSEMPVVGSAFQPNDAGAIITQAFERMNEFAKVKATVDDYIKRGETAKATELIDKRSNEYMMGEVAASFKNQIGDLTKYEQAIRASSATPKEKRDDLAKIREMKIMLSQNMLEIVDKTTPQ